MAEVITRVRAYLDHLKIVAAKEKDAFPFLHDEQFMAGIRKFIELTLGIRVANQYSTTVLVSVDPEIHKAFRTTLADIRKVWRAGLKEEKAKKGWATRQLKLLSEQPLLGARESVAVALCLNRLNIALPANIKGPLADSFVTLKEQATKMKDEAAKKKQLAFVSKMAKTLGITIPRKKKESTSPRTIQQQIKKKADDLVKEQAKIKRALLGWLRDYIKCRMMGNVKLAKDIKRNIDAAIGKHKFNRDEIYYHYGDPDRPENRAKIRKLVGLPPEKVKKPK